MNLGTTIMEADVGDREDRRNVDVVDGEGENMNQKEEERKARKRQ